MFHANRARRHQGADHRINGSTSNQAARHLSIRPGPLLFALAVLTLLSGALVGTASATSQDPGAPPAEPSPTSTSGVPERLLQPTQTTEPNQTRDQPPLTSAQKWVQLLLKPAEATIDAGNGQDYTARLQVRAGRYRLTWDVTGLTRFEIDPDGSCKKATCSATKIGPHTVTGILPPRAFPLVSYQIEGTATLHVKQPDHTPRPKPPHHLRLEPNPETIPLGDSQPYEAFAIAEDNEELGKVTGQTVFTISKDGKPSGTCKEATCTPDTDGAHLVTGIFTPDDRVQGTATVHVTKPPEPPDHLKLEPVDKTIKLGDSQAYQAFAVAKSGQPLGEVTRQTVFALSQQGQPSGRCNEASCTPAKDGDHTVTGHLAKDDRVTGTATLHVIKPPHHLEVKPIEETIQLGRSQTYTAYAVAEDGEVLGEVTKQTRFELTPSGGCQGPTCTPTEAGDHTVTGTLSDKPTVKGTATLHVKPPPEPEPDHLVLDPSEQTIQLGPGVIGVTYKAHAFAKDKALGEVTGQTVFTISQQGRPSGRCTAATCAPDTDGDHLVTGAHKDKPSVKGIAMLHVKRGLPSISSVTPGSTFPGLSVEVRGTTGSCNRTGTLTFHGIPNKASMNVTADERGDFVARFTVPTGTFPNAYKLELAVDCNGQLQRAARDLAVTNLAPVAVDDSASTTQDTPVAVAVTANDRDPDPGNGYQTLVVQGGQPSNGTIQAQPDGIIIYTPHAGFLGQDQFRYSLCDSVINAAGTADCDIATVIVTVNPGTPTTTSGPPSSGPPSSVPPTTTGPCAPSAGDLHQHLQVTPFKGPGGTKLRITAKLDRKLAACPLRLLLGGNPLGPDLSVGSDGTIAAQVPVPTDAIPGSSILRLATTSGQILDQTSFEILPTLLRRWWERDPYRLLLGVGALLAGALARAAIRRLRRLLQEHDQDERDHARRYGLRAEPCTRPSEVTVAPDTEDQPTLVVRLQPHGDAAALTLQEVPG